MNIHNLYNYFALFFFLLAIINIFSVEMIKKASLKNTNRFFNPLLHSLCEPELIFGFWAIILIIFSLLINGLVETTNQLKSLNFNEPIFIFIIMSVCSTLPILTFSEKLILKISQLIPINKNLALYFSILSITPLFGSLITEPASITISSFLLLDTFFTKKHSLIFKYSTIALLFLNTSIGGTLTHFSAPPVLMVSAKWNWDLVFMLKNFSVPTILSIFINTSLITYIFRNEIKNDHSLSNRYNKAEISLFKKAIFSFALLLIIYFSHNYILCTATFLTLLLLSYKLPFLKTKFEFKTSLQVAYFLAGLIIIGSPQKWWLNQIIESLSKNEIYISSLVLTSIVDNAALTYLGSLAQNLSPEIKLFLVKGSVVGGGLTIIANAPNPAAFNILKESLPNSVLSPLKLIKYSIPLTFITGLIFYIF